MPKDIVNGTPEDFDNYVSVEEGTLTVKYEPEEVINFMYNEIYCEAQSIILNCLDDIYTTSVILKEIKWGELIKIILLK